MKKILFLFLTVVYFLVGISQNKITIRYDVNVVDYRIPIKDSINKAIANDIDTIYFTAGTYKVGYDPTLLSVPRCEGNLVRSAFSLCNIVKLLVFAGDGESSIIELGPITQGGDYHIFQLIASDSIQFLNITLDGRKDINNYNEQRHLVFIQGCKKISFKRVIFKNAIGDGIKLMGLYERPTRGVTISECQFIKNGRSGVAFQREIEDVSIYRSKFISTGDQDIDFEPSSSKIFSIKNVSISLNEFIHSNTTNSVTLSNSEDIRFNDNVIVNGSIHARHLKDFLITNNTLLSLNDDLTTKPRIHLQGLVINGKISSNIIDTSIIYTNNLGSTIIPNTINFSHDRDDISNHIQITNNTIYGSLSIGDAKNVLIEGNTIIRKNLVAKSVGINFKTESAKEDKEDIIVRNNYISNFSVGITIAPRKSNYKSLLIENNVFNQIPGFCIFYDYEKLGGWILGRPKLIYNKESSEQSGTFYKKIRGFEKEYNAVIYGYTSDLITPIYLGFINPPNLLAPPNSEYIYYPPKVANPIRYRHDINGTWVEIN